MKDRMRSPAPVLPRALTLLLLLTLSVLAGGARAAGLVDQLVDQLGVNKEQAAGGAGAIFDYARENLEPSDFATLAEGIPGMDGLLAAAPDAESSGSKLGKLGGMLGDSGGSMGALASLAGSFEALGLEPEMAQKFLPVVMDFVESSAGEEALGLLQGLF